METLKAMIKGILPSFVGFVVIYLIILLLKIHTIGGLALVLAGVYICIILYKLVYKREPVKWGTLILEYVKALVTVYIIIQLFWFSLAYGILGITIYFILYCVWYLFGTKRRRQNYMSAIRIMETAIYGKSLDKENWKQGELKRRKIKIVWRKNEDGKDNAKNKHDEKMA